MCLGATPPPVFNEVKFVSAKGVSYKNVRATCTALGSGWDLVSVQSVAHVKWLRDQAAKSGVDLTKSAGVPLGYDKDNTGRQYYDLTNLSRPITGIFGALRKEGWPGDYHTDQRSDCSGKGQQWAGFGWQKLPRPGIEDWGSCHPMNKILCERGVSARMRMHKHVCTPFVLIK